MVLLKLNFFPLTVSLNSIVDFKIKIVTLLSSNLKGVSAGGRFGGVAKVGPA